MSPQAPLGYDSFSDLPCFYEGHQVEPWKQSVHAPSESSSAGRLRSRSLCSVRYGRTHRGAETLCYGWLNAIFWKNSLVSKAWAFKQAI